MVETAPNKHKKVTITEDDVSTLLTRYTAYALLWVLREVAQFPDVKIDWNLIFHNLITAPVSPEIKSMIEQIKSPRELQLLWRHLAYRHPLVNHQIDAGTLPLDDDSDLEYEVEAFPPLGQEAVQEATNSVRVLACGSFSESTAANNSTIDGAMPNAHTSKYYSENSHAASLLRSSNGSLPVLGQTEVLEANNSANSIRKKRKWSPEEDLKLINGVQKWGEGNWSAMLKEEEKWGRTAGQLQTRWKDLKKKQAREYQEGANLPGVQLSQAQLAARRAINIALKDNLTAVGNGAGGTSNQASSSASNRESPITKITVPSPKQPSQLSNTSAKPAPLSSLPKVRSTGKKAPQKHSSVDDSNKKVPPKCPSVADSIQRCAVAAGARIASASDADAFCKVVQSKKPNSLPPNVHFICTGLVTRPAAVGVETVSISNGDQQAKGNPVKPSVPAATVSELPKTRPMPPLATEQSNASSSSSLSELHQQQDKTSIEGNVPGNKQSAGVQQNIASLHRNLPNAAEKSCSTSSGTAADNSQLKDEISKQVVVNPVPMDFSKS